MDEKGSCRVIAGIKLSLTSRAGRDTNDALEVVRETLEWAKKESMDAESAMVRGCSGRGARAGWVIEIRLDAVDSHSGFSTKDKKPGWW